MKVAIVGASGETGQSIIQALIQEPDKFEVTALCRAASIDKPEIQTLKNQGVSVVSFDLEAPHEEITKALVGQEIVISCLILIPEEPEFALANAAKAANVKRFVPSFFATSCPPVGVLMLREIKERAIRHIQKMYLPYTVIDIGWWYQSSLPRLPSGKIDYALKFPTKIIGDGNLPSALTDLRDIGKYVARIISDERTLNKYVFAYNEVLTQERISSTLEEVSGEKIPREYITEEEAIGNVVAAKKRYEDDPSRANTVGLTVSQYANTVWLRGDNLPERAAYLGYLNGKELYPDIKYTPFVEYLKELVAGKGKGIYANRVFGFEKDIDLFGKK